MKKVFALILALVLVLGMAAPAFADDTGITLTVNHIASGHTFTAYQLFSGTLNSAGILTDVKWGDGIKGDDLLAALKADDTVISNSDNTQSVKFSEIFENCTNAAAVAEIVAGFTTDGDRLEHFAKIASNHIVANKGTSSTSGSQNQNGTWAYTISGLEPGYYIIVDATKDENVGAEDYKTRYILSLTTHTSLTTKGSYTVVEKSVADTLNGTYDESIAMILNEVHYFKLAASIADDIDEYDSYYLEFKDTMSAGLTYQGLVEVYVEEVDNNKVYLYQNGEWLKNDTVDASTAVETVSVDKDTKVTSISVKFPDLKKVYPAIAGDDVLVVKYAAVLNEDAVIGGANPNEVEIVYSNGPSVDDYGTSLPDYAFVFSFGLRVLKVDNDNVELLLPGAEFQLYHLHGTTKYYAVLGAGEDADKIVSWTPYATEADRTAAAEADPDNAEEILATPIASTLITDANGTFAVDGLDQDVLYYLHETKAPTGYNTMFTDVKFSIHPTYVTENGEPKVKSITYTVDGQSHTVDEGEDFEAGRVAVTVVNDKGSTLPSTGGIGTTIFYMVGGLLAVAAVVLLVTKKRMSV